MRPGGLNTGLKAPAVNLQSNLQPPMNPGMQVPPGNKGGNKPKTRALPGGNTQRPEPKKPAKQSETTLANARLRDSGTKSVEIKGWIHVILTKEGVSKEMRDGYLADIERHRKSMTDATEALQHAITPGVKTEDAQIASLTKTLTKSLDDYNAFVRQLKVIFELRLLISC